MTCLVLFQRLPPNLSSTKSEKFVEFELDKVKSLSSSNFDEIRTYSVVVDDEVLTELFRILKPKKKLSIHGCISDRNAGQLLQIDLKIHGFVDIMIAKDPATEERFAICQKPGWDLGAGASLPKSISSSKPISNASWKLTLNDLAEDDVVDENELLNDGIVPKTRASLNCSPSEVTGNKRACANCTCGLSEIEAREAQEGIKIERVAQDSGKSSCGNCYKGDAFRCGSCPFLGKPAFEPGQEKITLALSDDSYFR
jgi:hypothetical protein